MKRGINCCLCFLWKRRVLCLIGFWLITIIIVQMILDGDGIVRIRNNIDWEKYYNRSRYYIDLGTFNGDTIIEFSERRDSKYYTVYGWECDKHNFKETSDNILNRNLKFKDIYLLPYCVWYNDTILSFKDENGEASKVMKSDIYVDNVISVPAKNFIQWFLNTFKNYKQDYIALKMDIECTEFYIIPLLFEHNIIHYIDELQLEWHDWLDSCQFPSDILNGKEFNYSLKNIRLHYDKMLNETGLLFHYALPSHGKPYKKKMRLNYDRKTWNVPWNNGLYFRKQKYKHDKSPWNYT